MIDLFRSYSKVAQFDWLECQYSVGAVKIVSSIVRSTPTLLYFATTNPQWTMKTTTEHFEGSS